MDNNLLLKSLYKFYDKKNLAELLNVLDRKQNDVSLRLVDWLATNYSKSHLTRVKSSSGKYISIYSEYKLMLKAFSKKQFDPFCRRERITFNKYGIQLVTTIGQLNFFKWAITEGILAHTINHAKEIEKDMLAALDRKTRNKPSLKRRVGKKRGELSMCATKAFTCVNLPCVIMLD